MHLATITVLLQLAGVLVAIVASYVVLLGPIPSAWRLPPKRPMLARFHSHLPLIAMNQVMLVGGSWMAFVAAGQFLTPRWPGIASVALQVGIVFFVDDVWFYFLHRAFHRKKSWYRRIHRVHHEAYAPLPLDYLYVHPMEWVLGTVGVFVPFGIIWLVLGEIQLWPLWIYTSWRQLREIDLHSGLRSFVARRIPFLGTSDHHDLHHAKPTRGNYGSTLLLWDRVMGTEIRESEPELVPVEVAPPPSAVLPGVS